MKRIFLLSGAALVLLLGVCAAAVVYGTPDTPAAPTPAAPATTPPPVPVTGSSSSTPPAPSTVLPTEDIETVLSVHDGDTFTLQDKRVVRLLGINAPEVPPTSNPAACYGTQAQEQVRTVLAPGTKVSLSTDPSQGPTDRYGRLLRYVSVPAATIPDLSEYLLQGGYAKVYTSYPVARTPVYKQAEADARAAHRGLWGAC